MVPAETDILCESCGYTLNGLPQGGRCPECGSEIHLSVAPEMRKPPAWEEVALGQPLGRRFARTTLEIIFHPRQFYRSFNSRGEIAPALNFARIHWICVAIILAIAFWMHSVWSWHYSMIHFNNRPHWLDPLILLGGPVGIYLAISWTQRLAARLTAIEAAFWEYRLPHAVVLRALYYHAAHWLPVAFLILFTTGGYLLLTQTGVLDPDATGVKYVFVLAAEVILAAGYLFRTYWTAMRSLMWANR